MIKISERVNLAIHALGYMATYGGEKPFTVSHLANRMEVSPSHLAKVMQMLVKHGFITSVRGAKGGFSFVIDPLKISLLNVFEAVDGPLMKQDCLLPKPMCKQENCILNDILTEATEFLCDKMSRIKISDFMFKTLKK